MSDSENSHNKTRVRRAPAKTPEARENQIIADAYDLAERKIRDGTASNQLILHWLKVGSTKERLEKEKLENEVKLLKAKTEALESQKNVEKLYIDAINAMKTYSGQSSDEMDEEDAEDLY